MPVVLTPRAFELLATLVQDAGELLPKDELMKRVWGTTVVEENNLARQISTLRKVLHERPGQHEYILTVPGVGYRFVAPVTEAAAVADPVVEVEVPAELPATRPAGANRALWIGVFAVVTVATVVGVMLARQSAAPEAVTVQRSLEQLTFGPDLQGYPAWSPDGRRVAFASNRLGNSDIWVQQLSEPEPTRLTSSPGRDWQPDWSPDGKWIAYRSEQNGGGLYVVAADGGEPRQLTDFGSHPRWSPAGDLILFSNATSRTGARKLYVVDPSGGASREVASELIQPLISSAWASSIDAAWHPDGRRISVWGRQADGRWKFATLPVIGGPAVFSQLPDSRLRDLDDRRVRLGSFVWAASGKFLYFEGQSAESRNIWRVGVDPSTLAWTSSPERLTTDVGEEADLALSPQGTRLAFTLRTQRTSVWALDFDPELGHLTGREQELTPSSPGQVDVDSPRDGSRLAYRSVRAGRSELWEVTTADREERVLLVSNEGSPSSPRWSSDGRRIAYSRPAALGSSTAPGKDLVAVLSTEQRREQLVTIPGQASFRPSDWSRDGQMILGDCRSQPRESVGICVVPAPGAVTSGPGMRVLVHDPARSLYGPRFSPDQRWVSFVAVDPKASTVSRIYVAPVEGGPWIPITEGRSFDDKPRWALDGRTVYFVSDRSGYLNVLGRRFDPLTGRPSGDPFFVTSFDSAKRGLPSNPARIEFSIAEHRIFLPITETESSIWVLDDVDK